MCARHSASRSPSATCASARRTTNATTSSPHCACARPTTHDDLAALAGRQRIAAGVDDAYLHRALRDTDRGETHFVIGMPAIGVMRARQCGDGHRAFALAVDLHEPVAEHVERTADVGEIH